VVDHGMVRQADEPIKDVIPTVCRSVVGVGLDLGNPALK
jgi:hypothetical protein